MKLGEEIRSHWLRRLTTGNEIRVVREEAKEEIRESVAQQGRIHEEAARDLHSRVAQALDSIGDGSRRETRAY